MDKLPKEVRVDILDYLDNSDWYSCVKASKLFLVDNEATIKQRQRLWYAIDVIIRTGNIDDIKKLLKRRLHSNPTKRQQLNRYLEQVLPIKSLRNDFLSGIASYLSGNLNNRDYVLYGNGQNGKEEFLFFIARVFLTLNMHETLESDDELIFDVSDDDIDLEQAECSSENNDRSEYRGLFVYRNRKDAPDIEYHKSLEKIPGYSYSGLGLSFCLSMKKSYFAFSTRTEPDFEVFKYEKNGKLVFTNVDNLVNSYDFQFRKNIVMIPFVSKFVDEPNCEHPFEFKRIKDIKNTWDKLVIEFIILLCELNISNCT